MAAWKNPVSGDWDVASNWSTDTVPTSGEGVNILAPGAYIVTISSPVQAAELFFDSPQAQLVENSGSLTLIGTLSVVSGFVSLNEANTLDFNLAASVGGGVLAFGSGAALGSGTVSLFGGELLASKDETLTNALNIFDTSTIAATHGTTLIEDASSVTILSNSTLNIGSPGEDGTILWRTNGASSVSSPATDAVHVQAGTLKALDANFSELVGSGVQTTVSAGGTIDLGGFDATISGLLGAGTVTDSGAAATLTLAATSFSGTISGALSVDFNDNASLSGLEDYSGSATLAGGISVNNSGTYDLVANTNVSGTSSASFINQGVFEKTGGGGVSDVTTDFVNNGALNVLSGSIVFSGGFTNNDVIHGLVTQEKFHPVGQPAEVIVSAAVASDFSGDTRSDILWQNADGQASIWDMNGNALTGGGAVSTNPGPAWKAVGTGDFNGDGHADILWQNTSTGQASIWDMNGKSLIGGGPVSPDPGPAWQAVGSGDFNGDGLSDILFQNASSGQVSIWEMNGNKLVGGGHVSPNPGPAWKAIGTGDFNGDGFSDILFQNTSTGQVSIWEMEGNKLIGGGPVSPNPGPAWKAIGTGDFNHDGRSDILFQNTGSGQVSIWEMNGNKLIGGGPVSPNPGLSWHAVGTGDFNGDGHSDILFQNASGQASIWEMNGNTLIGGGPVSVNPGASWRAVA